jgi:hypothetical protein
LTGSSLATGYRAPWLIYSLPWQRTNLKNVAGYGNG